MIHLKGIDWQPTGAMPDDRKDGRKMLLWANGGPDIGTWEAGNDMFHQLGDPDQDGYWQALYGCFPISGVTHWADVTAPE